MKRIEVTHRVGSYPIIIGPGAVEHITTLVGARRALIITDENVARHWLAALTTVLPESPELILPCGDSNKTLMTVSTIWSKLAELEFGRDSVLIALGGGVIGDITGFAAACWMRGTNFIQVPTTLLGQVDASVGGKTGINLPAGKNLVGAFHQPIAVLADTATLATLPDREYRSGIAEVVKAALLADETFFDWLESNAQQLAARAPGALEYAIGRSCEIKAAIVAHDERENGRRALLNLGHTFAHAIETVTGYEKFLHGEAVSIGLVLAAAFSERHCSLDIALRPRLVTLLESFGLPVQCPADLEPGTLLDAMRLDKKHTAKHWRLVALEAIGKARIVDISDATAVRAVLAGA